MWDVAVPVVGQCRDCGQELGTEMRVRATAEWVARYNGDIRLRRRVDRALVRMVLARHARRCPVRLAHTALFRSA